MNHMSLKGRSVLVTGGAGFIGSHLVDRIIEEDPAQIVVIDNFFLGSETNLNAAKSLRADIEIVRIDATEFNAVASVVKRHGIESIFDLAVVPLPTSLTYPSWTVQSNVSMTLAVCELARLEEYDRLIHFSTSEVYGSARSVPMNEDHPHDAITPYAASKSAADQIVSSYVSTFGINASAVRPFNNIGPRQNPGTYAGIVPIVIKRVLSGSPIEIFGDGEQTRDFTWVRDTAKAAVALHNQAGLRGKAINVASGKETSINTLVGLILEALDAPNHPIVHLGARPGDVRRHCADVSVLRSLLPDAVPEQLSISNLVETIDWYRGQWA
jgi:UDP-glucose 4-epimerase